MYSTLAFYTTTTNKRCQTKAAGKMNNKWLRGQLIKKRWCYVGREKKRMFGFIIGHECCNVRTVYLLMHFPNPLISIRHSQPLTFPLIIFFQIEEEEELALIFLQKVLRGRAIQNMVSYRHCRTPQFYLKSILALSTPRCFVCLDFYHPLSLMVSEKAK